MHVQRDSREHASFAGGTKRPPAHPPTMTIALLAEELLREILRYLLVPPYADFLRFPNNDAIPRWSADWTVDDWWDASLGVEERVERARPADVLLVCKTWLRIGTPLLYECVSVWAPRHTKAVAALLTREPQLGCAVRCLRLEGGMGKALATVVKHAAGFHTLYVSLHVKSSEGVVGLQKSAALMNPRALYIHGGPSTHNKWYYDAAMVIEDAIADQWKQSLVSQTQSMRPHTADTSSVLHLFLWILPDDRKARQGAQHGTIAHYDGY